MFPMNLPNLNLEESEFNVPHSYERTDYKLKLPKDTRCEAVLGNSLPCNNKKYLLMLLKNYLYNTLTWNS